MKQPELVCPKCFINHCKHCKCPKCKHQIKKKKICKHKWIFDVSVPFKGHNSGGLDDYYRTVYHCEKCMQQDIQTIYR